MQVSRISVAALLVMSCAHSSTPAPRSEAEPPPDDHWEPVTDRRFIYTDHCGTGPFEVSFPAREIEYGRRTVLMVYGARNVQLDNRIDGPAGQWGLGVATITEGDHSRCRADDTGDPIVIAGAPATPGKSTGSSGTGTPTKVLRREPPKSGYDTPAAELPQLVEYPGELPNVLQQATAVAWMPKGNPFIYADEYWTAHSEDNVGAAGFRIRFWFNKPSNLDGLVFRFVDERLVPDLPLDVYGPRFAVRVATAQAHRKARQPELVAEYEKDHKMCELFPDDKKCVEGRRERGRIPPPPRKETPPKAPAGDVDWAPGYWSWTKDVDDFVWIDGTYVVRAPKVVATAPPPAPPPPTVAAPAVVAEPIETREITASIDPPPPVRVEVIAAPPAQPGVVWIAGHWRLVGPSWQWVAGSWSQPPSAGERFRSPSVRVRGTVRVYLPGRWIRVR